MKYIFFANSPPKLYRLLDGLLFAARCCCCCDGCGATSEWVRWKQLSRASICLFLRQFVRSVDMQKQKQQQLVAQLIQIWQKLTIFSLLFWESQNLSNVVSHKKCASLTSTSFYSRNVVPLFIDDDVNSNNDNDVNSNNDDDVNNNNDDDNDNDVSSSNCFCRLKSSGAASQPD